MEEITVSDQTSTVKISSVSSATDNTDVKVELAVATLTLGLMMAARYAEFTYPKEKKRKSYVDRKLRKMGR